jgi:prepilin-type N-terminal cleavage/methylation domain-containing protein
MGSAESNEVMSAKNSCRSGFSIAELAMAIAVLGIVAALAVPRLGGMMARMAVSNMVDELAQSFALAQSRAIANPRVHCGLYFDTVDANNFILFFDDNNNTAYDAGADRLYDIKTALPNQVRFFLPDSAPVQDLSIVFTGNGAAVRGGGIGVRHTRTLYSKRIYVVAQPGRIVRR